MYWSGLYIPAASESLRAKLPHLIEIANASYSVYDENVAKRHFMRSRAYSFNGRPFSRSMPRENERPLKDSSSVSGQISPLQF